MTSTAPEQPARLPGLSLVTKPDRPCDLCRRRKVKCFLDVGDTSCARCRTGGQACTFEEQPQKRPRRMLSLTAQDAPHTNSTNYAEQARQSPNGAPVTASSGDGGGLATSGGGSAPIRTTSHHNPPIYTPTSMPSTELPDDTSHLDAGPTLNLYNDATVEHVGPSADFGPDYLSRVDATASPGGSATLRQASTALLDAKLEKERRTTITQDEGPDAVHFKIVSTDESRITSLHTRVNFPEYDAHVDLPAVLRTIRQNAVQLVDLYIRVVHPSYPIINPLRVVQWLGPALRPNHEINHRDIAVFPLVAAQMLVAYHWRNFAPTTLTEIDLSVLRTYLNQAVDRELERPRLVTVQSLLLRNSILASTMESKNMFRVWNSMGVLVTTAQNLGLHRSPETWNINIWEMQLRKRLWWAIFTTEKWLAYSIGRSSLIHDNEWTVKPLNPADFENYTIPTARFVAMTELTCILSDIHIQLFTPKTTAQLTTDFAKSKALCKPLFSRLEQWRTRHDGLFRAAQYESDNSADSADDLQTPAMLQLAHFAVKVALHRALMRCGSAVDATVRHDAVQTMQDIGVWAKRLTSQDILSVWWSAASLQFVAVTNFFLGLVFTSPKEDEFRTLQKILQGWRWQLRMHLQLFPALVRSALQRIDELFKEGDQMEAIWKSHRMPTPAIGNTRPNSPKHAASAGQSSSHAMWDLARLATEANGSAPTLQQMQSLMPSQSQTSTTQGFNFNVASTPSNLPSNPAYLTPGDPLANLFNMPTTGGHTTGDHAFQFGTGLDFSTDTGTTDFSLEDFMSWSNLNAFTNDDNSRNFQEGQDWAL